ncbi:DUF2203 domain-containing protein [Paenibacillus cremeus]|uniref:DUF2203 family protein n=1 Tax=Paenibacillus cremeus TaxID=2163881 RepID=A0A559K021_9BACL|nr:DUF2203 domain-containing protein [Paenibacillus cremeus]TVY05502.1 DUF2203 family protein [Paenibacillus cremeus]
MKKYFTPEEANALLPSVRHDLERLQAIKRRFEVKFAQLHALKEHVRKYGKPEGEDPFFALECELEMMQLEADTGIRSLQLKGAELKDVDSGLIDFPAQIDGEEVLLCWKQGEERIEYYHGLHDGFIGRKRLSGE